MPKFQLVIVCPNSAQIIHLKHAKLVQIPESATDDYLAHQCLAQELNPTRSLAQLLENHPDVNQSNGTVKSRTLESLPGFLY